MAEKKKKDNLIVPNVLGLELDIAGDVFDDHNIKYEIQEKKVISFLRDKNCVVKTVPKFGTTITPDTVVKVYPCKFKIGPWILLGIILIGIILFILNKSGATPLFFGEPQIDMDNKGFNKSSIIYVKDDADFNYSTIDHYEYCINKNKNANECTWNKTYTKSVSISKSGTWYVWFKGISEDNNESALSNRLKVQIDNEIPVISNIERTSSTKSIEVRVNAKDTLSGIDKYYYSIDNHEFIESNKSYTFTSLEENKTYDIKIRVVDKAGNMIDAETRLNTKSSEAQTLPKVIPQINMINIPSNIIERDNYELKDIIINEKYKDNTKCYIDDKEITNLNDLTVGKYDIKCVVELDNLKITAYKTINVLLPDGEDEILDEYVKLNLDYPKEATNYMYRLISDDVRVDGEGWNYYTNRLYIKKDLVDKIIIKYNLNGEKIISRDNMFIDIVPSSYTVLDGDEVEIRINTNNTEGKVYYSTDNNTYYEYKNPFKVKGNTLVTAYVENIFKSYNKELDMIVDTSEIKTDAVYITNIYPSIGDKKNTDVTISLDKLPNEINNKEVYSIPSSYSYGTHGLFNVICTSDNKVVNSTSDLTKGEHDIICTITALDGETKQVSKHINIKVDNYKYDLDNIPSIIKQGDEYILDDSCNIKNTSKLSIGKHNIVCDKISKNIEVVNDMENYIDINNIPDEIIIGTLYQLPSHYYASNIKYLNCLDEDNNIIYNTSILSLGEHNITCILSDGNNTLTANKTIKVIKPKYGIVISK